MKNLLSILWFFLAFCNFSTQSFADSKKSALGIATGHTEATEAAHRILLEGGNAVDAAVAASFALNVVQPHKMGIGGGGFMLVWNHGKVWINNHRERAPSQVTPEWFLNEKGESHSDPDTLESSPKTVGIPGTVLGLWETHKKFGKLPWKKVLEPAIRLARAGHSVSTIFAHDLADEWERISIFPGAALLFGSGEGMPLVRGQRLTQPDLARTFEKIAEQGGAAFYQGALADEWLAQARTVGVTFKKEDLANYRTEASVPVQTQVFGVKAWTMPEPSSSGLTVMGTLRFLEHYYQSHKIPEPMSAERVIVTFEALRATQKIALERLADHGRSKVEPGKWLGSLDERKLWESIESRIKDKLGKIATVARAPGNEDKIQVQWSQTDYERWIKKEADENTAHFSVMDRDGMAVSYTTTIEALFGSGLVVPKFGFVLNNELSDFAAKPGHPNSPMAGAQPKSNMSPTFLYSESFTGKKDLLAVVGCAGGARIPTSIVLFLENYYIHKMDARGALASTRFFPKNDEGIEVEKGLPKKTHALLAQAGYRVVEEPQFWSVGQMLIRRGIHAPWEAATEPRYEGVALSY